jgi:hypothetical protein
MQVSVDGFVGRRGEGDAWQLWDWSDACPWDADLRGRFNGFFEIINCILLNRDGGRLCRALRGHRAEAWRRHSAEEYGGAAAARGVANAEFVKRTLHT